MHVKVVRVCQGRRGSILWLSQLILWTAVLGDEEGFRNMDNKWRELSQNDLEKEVSPSRWNPSKTPDQVIQEYISTSIAGTTTARNSIPCSLNISYGDLPTQKFDIYGTDLAEDAPIFFWIHGGYWQEGSKDISGGFAPLNYKHGIKTIVLGYTLAPDAKIPQMEQELISALKHTVQMNPKAKLIVGGHSAGGQLTASLLHSQNLPQEIADKLRGVILVSGVFDLRPLVTTYVNDPLKMDEKEAESLSALFQPFNTVVDFDHLKIHVMVGGNDSPEFQRQAIAYLNKLRTRSQHTSYYKSESDDHFTIVENLAAATSNSGKSVQDFLKSFPNLGSGSESRTGPSVLSVGLLVISVVCPVLFDMVEN